MARLTLAQFAVKLLAVTLVALAGPLLVTVSVYVSRLPWLTGLGEAAFVIATSAVVPIPTMTLAVAILLPRSDHR